MTKILETDDHIRLDNWLKKYYPDIGFGQMQKFIRTGQIRVDGKRAKANARLAAGQIVRMPPFLQDLQKEDKTYTLSVKDIDFIKSLVIYKDKNIIAINKPHGIAVQGGTKTKYHIDYLLKGLQFDAPHPPKLVHRLDKDTSGVLLLARTKQAAKELMFAFQQKQVQKTYWALAHNVPEDREGRMQCMMKKNMTEDGEKMTLDADGKWSETEYIVKESLSKSISWLELYPLTGRTHQLRLHCAELGCPIIGDYKYGNEESDQANKNLAKNLCLHAYKMVWHRPSGPIEISAPAPEHMQKIGNEFEWNLQ